MKKTPKANDLTTLIGGEEIDVTHTDGRTERVKVRQLPVELYPRFQEALTANNEAMLTALYCDRDLEWVRSLTAESYNAAADKGEELNLPFIGAWARRGKARNEAYTPGITEKVEKMMEKMLADRLARLSDSLSTSQP